MQRIISAFILGLAITSAGTALAEESTHAESPQAHAVGDAEVFPHPQISTDGGWAASMWVVVLFGFFLPAAILGPIVRRETPEEVPPAHSHEEPTGASGHHGHSGTHAEDPHH